MSEFLDISLDYDDSNSLNNIIQDSLALFIQEIELAIKIGPEEIWGQQYSIDLKKYVFNQYITLNQIKNEIDTFINMNCEHAGEFQHDLTVQLINIEGKDLLYIVMNIYLTDGQKVTQKFLLN